jgi:hypothetical protein
VLFAPPAPTHTTTGLPAYLRIGASSPSHLPVYLFYHRFTERIGCIGFNRCITDASVYRFTGLTDLLTHRFTSHLPVYRFIIYHLSVLLHLPHLLASSFTGLPVYSVYRFTCLPVYRFTGLPTHRFIGLLAFDRFTYLPVYCIYRFTGLPHLLDDAFIAFYCIYHLPVY